MEGRALQRTIRNGRLVWLLAGKSPALLSTLRFPRFAERLLSPFEAGGPLAVAAYEDLLRYFALGWQTYRDADGAGASYPGLPSWSGAAADRLEGFSRIMPLFAAWCASGREPGISLPDGTALDLPGAFERGLVAGTDPASPAWWGDMPGRSHQAIVEAADIALALWLLRDRVWAGLSETRRRAVVDWLSLVEQRPGLDNNWHLFYVLIDRVLAALGHPGRIPSAPAHYARVKAFHLGDGWFTDGPDGRVDFYNAWGFHYALHWIGRIDPDWDPDFLHSCERRFLATYRQLIGPAGLPILGRSICYRLAAPAPLVLGHANHRDLVSAGEARRALDAVWGYFIRHGAVRHGSVTQGYHGADPRLLDPYSGPASPLWSLRSLVAALAYPRDDAFWRAGAEPLPVERGDYEVTIAGPRWRVTGERDAARITVEVLGNPPDACPPLEPVSWRHILRRYAEGRWAAPRNAAAQYARRFYRSDRPLGGDGAEPRGPGARVKARIGKGATRRADLR